MLSTTVKASGVTHLTDARYFAAWEVAYLGFAIGPNGISTTELAAMQEWITGPQILGEIQLLETNWRDQLSQTKLDGIQVGELVPAEDLTDLKSLFPNLLVVETSVQGYTLPEDLAAFLEERAAAASHFLLNFTTGGIVWEDILAGRPFSLDFLSSLAEQYPILLEIDGPTPADQLQSLPKLAGFSVRGGSEEKVGFKDFDDLDVFFESIFTAS